MSELLKEMGQRILERRKQLNMTQETLANLTHLTSQTISYAEMGQKAICLGHQLMALATGGDTHKMKYGHRGGNHPVKDLATGRVYISSQNHGYVVDSDILEQKGIAKPAFVNVNDGTNEGMAYIGKNIFTVQFHPEACPGPQDSSYLFDRFMEMMGGTDHAEK